MKKGIFLSLLAVIFAGVVIFAIWYINEAGKVHAGSRDSFIPSNSALVVKLNSNASLSPELQENFAEEIRNFRDKLLSKMVDTLIRGGYASDKTRTLAMRVEGKGELAFLYVMDSKGVLSRGEMADFLNTSFGAPKDNMRKYDGHKIYSLKKGKEEVYFSISEGVILLSDSDLYIENGLGQFDREEESGEPVKSPYRDVNKYFSAGSGINLFINTGCFADLLPLFVQYSKISEYLDITKCFKWGALDGDINAQGLCLNGFMHYSGLEASYMRTLEGQQPREGILDGVIPFNSSAFTMLNLSNLNSYFSVLEQYRYSAGLKEQVTKRKIAFTQLFGSDAEKELQDLLQGEFAMVDLGFDPAGPENDGLVIAHLKSGSLCEALIARMLQNYAKAKKMPVDALREKYSIDRDKSFTYYSFPADDFAAVCWGYLFGNIKNRYVLIEDNYLVFASSENAVKAFIKDYVHGSFVRDAEWYKKLRTKLSLKYNLAYFARIEAALPYYKYVANGSWQDYLKQNENKLAGFSTAGVQFSNEGNMLYNTILLSTEKIENSVRPHIVWQTKLDAAVTVKPTPVKNHVTGERELFVQDDNSTIYLINEAGRVLWKQALGERINSEVYQVDVFRNGKLQYLFSTPSRMYLVDRNGEPVGRFPVSFKSPSDRGITLYDYDGNKDYRVFVPCEDQKVYLYDLDGSPVKGWDSKKADKEIVSKVYYFRVDGKDYIVYADRYRFYILDRKGNERVQVSSVFDLKVNTDIYLTRKGGNAMLAFANIAGPVNLVDFKGNVQTVKCEKLSPDYNMNVADINGDGVDDYVFTDADRMFIYNLSGQLLYEKELEAHSLDYPYIYRFSDSDTRIGLIDKEQNRMLLLRPDGVISAGFPIPGDSPFSIVFSGSDGFFLFAGTDNGTVIKYRVQR